MTRLFSDRKRPVHLGPFPLERLARQDSADLASVPAMVPVGFNRPDAPESIVNAMREYQAMLDAIRDGIVNPVRSEIPDDPRDRADHLKAFGYFNDAAMAGICRLPGAARLDQPIRNADIDRLAHDLNGFDRYLAGHFKARWGIDRDLYQESINNNLSYLKYFLEKDPLHYAMFLRRMDRS